MPGNDSGPGGDQGQPTVVHLAEGKYQPDTNSPARRRLEADRERHAAMEALDDAYVAGAWRRNWQPEIRRLRRQLREAA